jgi:hypothetical protein
MAAMTILCQRPCQHQTYIPSNDYGVFGGAEVASTHFRMSFRLNIARILERSSLVENLILRGCDHG